MPTNVTRRDLLGLAPAATLAVTLPSFFAATPAAAQAPTSPLATSLEAAVAAIENAIRFQNFMMDAYATGSTLRLIQSYSDQNGLESTAFTYDNAVSIHAYLASEEPTLLARAVVLGESLLYGQAHPFPFPFTADGRFPQGFFVNTLATDGSGAFVTPAATPFYFYTSTTGDQAWAGMALAQLYFVTKDARFLNGALLVANWIVTNTYDATGGGYAFGTNINYINGVNVSQPSGNGKSTEHNIDTYAFFTMLSTLTGNAASAANGMKWTALANHALQFVDSMFNPAGPNFWTGTLSATNDGINYYPVPEDCQTWSYLALLKTKYQQTINWALNNLEATDTASARASGLTGSQTIHGLVFDTASLNTASLADAPRAVWREATSPTIAALGARVLNGNDNLVKLLNDLDHAVKLLEQCIKAQTLLGLNETVGGKPIPTGLGLVAATSNMDTGFGYGYAPQLHIGATGWFLLAAQAANPFQLGYRVLGITEAIEAGIPEAASVLGCLA